MIPFDVWRIEQERQNREFWMTVRAALLMFVRAIEKRYNIVEAKTERN